MYILQGKPKHTTYARPQTGHIWQPYTKHQWKQSTRLLQSRGRAPTAITVPDVIRGCYLCPPSHDGVHGASVFHRTKLRRLPGSHIPVSDWYVQILAQGAHSDTGLN